MLKHSQKKASWHDMLWRACGGVLLRAVGNCAYGWQDHTQRHTRLLLLCMLLFLLLLLLLLLLLAATS